MKVLNSILNSMKVLDYLDAQDDWGILPFIFVVAAEYRM